MRPRSRWLGAGDGFHITDVIELIIREITGGKNTHVLFNICDPDTAAMFDTGRGHIIPRSGPVITELGNAVRDLMDRAYQV